MKNYYFVISILYFFFYYSSRNNFLLLYCCSFFIFKKIYIALSRDRCFTMRLYAKDRGTDVFASFRFRVTSCELHSLGRLSDSPKWLCYEYKCAQVIYLFCQRRHLSRAWVPSPPFRLRFVRVRSSLLLLFSLFPP